MSIATMLRDRRHTISCIRAANRSTATRREGRTSAFTSCEILKANPDMVARPDIAGRAEVRALKEGHEPYSQAFHQAVKRNFDQIIAPPLAKTSPSPEVFEPLPEAPSGASFVSAPVSGTFHLRITTSVAPVASGSSRNRRKPPNSPASVKLNTRWVFWNWSRRSVTASMTGKR